MREIQEDIAKDCLPQLLVLVEEGEAISITRDGKTVAHIIPASEIARDLPEDDIEARQHRKALAENFIRWCEKQTPMSASLRELLDWRRDDRA
ncbi:MAG: hypothetical protein J4G13_13450 [Dehalococcoidia bacterium]|nr:hypothetical protein [Dehalococcoidia bacterium]